LKRGEVYWAVLDPRSGAEQAGRRPVIVVSHDGFNQVSTWRSIIVVPVSTSKSQAKRGPTAVLLPAGTGGLTKPSVALCHQVTTLDRSKLNQRLGLLPDQLLREVEVGLQAALGIHTVIHDKT